MYRSVEDHLAAVLGRTRRTPIDRVGLDAADGATLALPALAGSAVPPFDNSAMDGFAVRFADVASAAAEQPVTLRVVADIPAGSGADPALAPETAARIMTGAPVPADADAIVPFEDTAGGLADSMAIAVVRRAPRTVGAHIRRAGEDLVAGDPVLGPGVLLGPLQLSALAAAGVAQVSVARRPRVAVVSTGSELVTAGEPLRRGQIPESNSILLAGLVSAAGAEVALRRVVDDAGDGPAEVVAEAAALRLDAVVFTAG